MEEINALFQQRTQMLRDGPILYRGDPDLPALVSDELRDFVAQGVPEALLRLTIDTFIQVRAEQPNEVQDEYNRALQELTVQIKESPELKAYITSPSTTKLNTLVDKFSPVAPRKTILRAAGLAEYHHMLFTAPLGPLEPADMEELTDKKRQLDLLMADEPNISLAVAKAQDILDSCNSLVVAWILLIGYSPEGFIFRLEGQPPYAFDRTLTAFVFSGLRNHWPPDVYDGGYMLWWSQLFGYSSVTCPEYHNILLAVFTPPATEVLNTIIPSELNDVVDLAGAAFAALCTVYKSESMQQMILPRLAHLYLSALAPEQQPLDMPFRRWAWSMLPGLSSSVQGTLESVARWVVVTKKLTTQWAAPVSILSPFIGLIYTTGVALYEFIDRLIEIIVYGIDKFASPLALWLKEYLYLGRAWSSVVLPGARRRPKSVWALLFVNDFTRLDPGTRFALSCNVMQHTPAPSYLEWETRFQDAINSTKLADYELFPQPAIRPLRLPDNPWTVDAELSALAPLFPGTSRVTHIMDDHLEKWVKYNVPRGIDGQWFATPERVAQSIRRYDIERPEADAELISRVRETAHALANKFPEMYKYHQYFTIGHAMRRLKWDTNMSPGLGFIGNVRTRKLLRKHGFLAAIQEVATRYLMEGIHPGSPAHVFVKEQVVALEKLLAGKNVRTVTAMNLLSNTLALPFSIELSRAPPPEAYILNALPRSEGGYRPFFDDLRRHAHVLQADASEFDSKLAPVITVEGLAELRSIGFEQNPAIDIIRSQIYEHYFQMRHSALVDLTTGNVFAKTGGMLTGQINTSYDNRDSFRIVIITGWAVKANKPPAEFWDYCCFGNAGDDDAIASKDPYNLEFWKSVFEWCKDNTGCIINIEQVGWDELSLTALQPTPEMEDTAYYRAQLGMPTVDYGIRTEPAKLLLTKTEFKARHARLNDIPFRMAHVDSMVGTAYLSAYNPEIYQDLADLYKADLEYILLRFYERLQVVEERDKFGNLTALDIRGVHIRPRYQRVESRIDSMITSWLKKVKWPSYQRVFNIWVRPYQEERSSIAKHYRTLISNGPALPVATKLLYGLVGFREALYTIPNHVVRALPEFPGADISVTLKTPEFIIERFVWLSLFTKKKSVPTKQAFMNALREGPYASAASPVDFLEFIEQGDYMAELIKSDLEALRAQAVFVTLVYSFLERIINICAQIPLLGIPISLYALATRDVNRLYATANHIYWLAEGRSSSVISNLMPADPYAWMKQLAVIIVTGIPERWIHIPGLRHLLTWVPTIVEMWTLAAATVQPNVGRMTFKEPPMNSPWSAVVDGLLGIAADGARYDVTVVAPTGSGKSTLFVALLTYLYPRRKIWLLHPTVAARDEYVNDFLPFGHVQILKRGVERSMDAIIYCVTYGFFAQIVQTVLESDIILFDEVHLVTTEMWVCWWLCHEHIRIALTATPKFSIQPKTLHTLRYPGTRRFKMKMTYVNQTFEQLWTTLANTRRSLLDRALIICPTLQQVNFVRNTLSRLSFASSELSSDNPVPARTGIIVATSIADQALTITPPPTTVIDLGTALEISVSSQLGDLFPKFDAKIVPISQEVADQRAGRGGRSFDSEGFGLLNSPRSPHKPPARFPVAVFLHEDVVESVLASLGLRVPLMVLHDIPGILKYVQVARHVEGIQHVHNIIGAAVALLYLSSGTGYDTFVNDLLNYKYADILSDTMRVYEAQAKLLFPEPDLILAIPSDVRALLEAGVFECVIRDQPIPVAAFLFVDGWMVPVGSDVRALVDSALPQAMPSTLAPVIHRGMRSQEWNAFLGTLRVQGFIFPGTPSLHPDLTFGIVEKTPLGVVTSVPAAISAISSRVRRNPRIVDAGPRLWYLLTNVNNLPLNVYGLLLQLHAGIAPIRGLTVCDISDVPLQIHNIFAMAVVVASNLQDNQLLLVGDVPATLPTNLILRTDRILIWGKPDEITSVLLSPLTARTIYARAANLVESPNIFELLASIPVIIMDDLSQYALWVDVFPWAVLGRFVGNTVTFG